MKKRLVATNIMDMMLGLYDPMKNRRKTKITDAQDVRLIQLLRQKRINDNLIEEIRDRNARVWNDMKRAVVQQHKTINVFNNITEFAQYLKDENNDTEGTIEKYIVQARSKIEGYRIQLHKDHIIHSINGKIIYI